MMILSRSAPDLENLVQQACTRLRAVLSRSTAAKAYPGPVERPEPNVRTHGKHCTRGAGSSL